MPRKDYTKNNSSKNERAMSNRDPVESPVPSFGSNDIVDAMNQIPTVNNLTNLVDDISSSSNYSDFVSKANERSSGWYSTIMRSLPLGFNNIHNALLQRNAAEDYLKNNNMSWGDMEGYNDAKLLGSSNINLGQIASTGAGYLQNIGNDLGKLYSGQKSNITSGYSSRRMESW